MTETGEANAVITVDVNTRYQYVRGFGGMEVGWGNFPQTSAGDTEILFNPDTGLGLNILRIMIMPSNTDIRVTMNSLINGDRPDYYENVKIANKYGGYVLASPWSPPKEWKTNNSLLGNGRLQTKNYQDYANYLKSFALNMYENGAPIYAISIQNEPNFETGYDGCLWSAAEMKNFFSQVGHFTDGVKGYGGGKEIPSVRTMNGESANNPTINDTALNAPESRAVIDIVGRHTYGDRLYRYGKALDHPTDPKEVWMTEHLVNSGNAAGYPNDSTWGYVWKLLNDVDLSIRINDESAFIWWAAKRFYGLMGDGQYDTERGEILPRGYALSHYAKFARDAFRTGITAEGKTGDGSNINTGNFNSRLDSLDGTTARVTAFVSPDGNTISLVMFTPTFFNGTGGVNMGRIKIQLPDDFIIGKAAAMRTSENNYAKWEEVEICEDRTSAIVSLPRGHILSVKFTR
jgi:O-glycosyl hydrolase